MKHLLLVIAFAALSGGIFAQNAMPTVGMELREIVFLSTEKIEISPLLKKSNKPFCAEWTTPTMEIPLYFASTWCDSASVVNDFYIEKSEIDVPATKTQPARKEVVITIIKKL